MKNVILEADPHPQVAPAIDHAVAAATYHPLFNTLYPPHNFLIPLNPTLSLIHSLIPSSYLLHPLTLASLFRDFNLHLSFYFFTKKM